MRPGFKEALPSAPKPRTSPKATAEKLAILNSQLNQGFASLQTSQVESTRQIVEAIKSSPAPVSPFSNVNWTPILQGIANVVITSLGGKQVEFSTPTPAVQAPGEAQGVANIAQIKELIKNLMDLGNKTNVAIAAAVTAHSRMIINSFKLLALDLGLQIYYSDTDSLVLNGTLPEEHLDNATLGKLKLEHKIQEGIFVMPKVYYLKTEEGQEVTKCKGFPGKLSRAQYLELLEGRTLHLEITKWSRSLKESFVGKGEKPRFSLASSSVVLRPTPDMGLIISSSTEGATGVAGAEELPPPFFPCSRVSRMSNTKDENPYLSKALLIIE